MTADVYAGDDGLREGARNAQPAGAATFDIVADADADLLVRVGAVLNLLNVAPRAFHMEARPEGTATVKALVDCSEPQAELIARKLQQLTSVRDVVVKYSHRIHTEQGMISRRGFMGALAATPLLNEVALAQAARVNASTATQPVWLDSNENPAGPPRAAVEALIRSAPDAWRYGFEQQVDLTTVIAAREKLGPLQVTAGVGSGDVIAAAICAFTSASLPMITASPSYDIVVSFARRLGRSVVEIPLTKEWAYPVRDLAAAAGRVVADSSIYATRTIPPPR